MKFSFIIIIIIIIILFPLSLLATPEPGETGKVEPLPRYHGDRVRPILPKNVKPEDLPDIPARQYPKQAPEYRAKDILDEIRKKKLLDF